MGDIFPVNDLPDPRKRAEIEKDESLDPEAFRRVLKVSESDETDKQSKRRKPKRQEDHDELTDRPAVEKSDTSFEELLHGSRRQESLLSGQRGRKQPLLRGRDEVDQPNRTPMQTHPPTDTPKESFASPVESELSSSRSDAAKQTKKNKPQVFPTKKERKPMQTETVVPQKEELEATLITKNPKPFAPYLEKSEGSEKKRGEKRIKKEKVASPFDPIGTPAQESIQNQMLTPVDPKKKNSVTAAETRVDENLLLETESKEKDSKEREERLKSPSESAITDQNAPPPRFAPLLTEIQATNIPAYATLPKDLFEIFQTINAFITIECTKGISTTTVNLNMPNSVFHGCTLTLEHYDTAPHSLNVRLLGNPQATTLFDAHLNNLDASLKASHLAYKINLLRSSIEDEKPPGKRPLIRRKKRSSNEEK